MEKRVFLAIFLCFVVLALYQRYVVPPEPPKPAGTTTTIPSTAPSGTATATEAAATAEALPRAAPLVADTSARDIVVETDTVTAVITTRGAALKSWRLKKYFDAQHQPLELVPQNLPDTFPKPLSLGTDDPQLSATLRTALFLPDASSLSLGSSTGRLIFEYRDAAGLTARKAFEFQPGGKAYLVKVDATIDVSGKPQPVIVAWGPAIGSGTTPDGARPFPIRAIQWPDGSRNPDRLTVSNLEKQSRYETPIRFAGVEDQYFLSAVLPGSQPVRIDYQPVTLPVPDDKDNRTRAFIAYSVRVPTAAALPIYMGPKEVDAMHAVDPDLTYAIDFGYFRPLVVPLLAALKWINRFAGNYGVSIILLTIFINLVIFPLRHRSMVSMRKMQSLQPEVKAIQDRYAKYKITDPERQKMNTEMMALYKQRGVNPASGCVPMLLTMPVLFAFYAMLSASIELRGTPFFGWLHDLSVKDPYYITPVLMGATMFWQQRMMPSTADPVQQKMFMFMPLIFTTMFLAAPSGLVVYWLVSNLLAIGQQYTTNRLIGAPVRPARPLPRASSGGGKR
jgi:YidC/Oxa1 family membrane protein insertase